MSAMEGVSLKEAENIHKDIVTCHHYQVVIVDNSDVMIRKLFIWKAVKLS